MSTTTASTAFADVLARLRDVVARGAVQLEHLMDMPSNQCAAIQMIGEGSTSVSDVARACLTHVSSASRTVDALVQEGLVDRTTDPRDRRAVVLSLTRAGQDCHDRMEAHRQEMLQRALSGLDDDDRHTLNRLLHTMVEGLSSALDDLEAS